MAGRVGHSEDASKHALQSAVDHVCSTEDDVIWLRLSMIRHVQSYDTRIPKFQSLFELQTQLLADMGALNAMCGGNTYAVVSFLFHALLPSSALRLLVASDRTFLDGVQLAMIYDTCNLLTCTSAERTLDLDAVLQRFGQYLLNTARPSAVNQPLTANFFSYFHRSDRIRAFVQLCHNSVACSRFFGRPDSRTREGELLQGTPSAELLDAMLTIADDAVGRGSLKTAINVLLVLSSVAAGQKDNARAKEGIQRAVRYINPALVHSVHPSNHNVNRNEILELTNTIRQHLQSTRADTSSTEVDAFHQLYLVAQFHKAIQQGEQEAALSAFLSLPFVPSSSAQVDAKAREFNTSVSEEVVAATPHTLLAALRIIHGLIERRSGEEKRQLQEQVQALRRWQSKWRHHVGQEILQQLRQFEGSSY